MLVVKIELHSAITGEITALQTLVIANGGRNPESNSEHPYSFDYEGWLIDGALDTTGIRPLGQLNSAKAHTWVRNHPQRDPSGKFFDAAYLVATMLDAMNFVL